MKRSALALVICLVFACVSYAQQDPQDQPASKDDIQRYMDAMKLRDMMTNMMQAMKPTMHKIFHDQIKDLPNLPPDFEAKMDKMMDNAFDTMSVDELLASMGPIYQKYLTKGDVDALIAFYSTPRGQRILKEMPAMTAEAMQASSGMMKRMMVSLQQQIQDQIAQVQRQSGAAKEQN